MDINENVKYIDKIYYSFSTFDLKLIDLKSMEVSNRQNGEDVEKNKQLESILNNLLKYVMEGITEEDKIKLQFRGNRQDKRIGLNRKNLGEEYNKSELKKVESEEKKIDNKGEILVDTFQDRIDSLLKVAFWANKAEKMRIAEYKEDFKKVSNSNNSTINLYKRILYEIKRECIKQVVIALMSDEKATENGNWGFDYDKKKKAYIFYYMNQKDPIPYSFHMPMNEVEKSFSKEIIDELEKIKNGEESKYSIHNRKEAAILTNREICKKNYIGNIELDEDERKYRIEAIKQKGLDKKERLSIEEVMEMKIVGLLENEQSKENINVDIKSISVKTDTLKKIIINSIIKSNGKIGIQRGNNLDINATIATIKYYFDNLSDEEKKEMGISENFKIEVERIPAGEDIKDFPCFDFGYLQGIRYVKGKNGEKLPQINADLRKGERSSVSILASLGFYVPKKLVEYADAVIMDLRVFDEKDGCILAREVPMDKLFEYAETKDEKTGEYLMDTTLSDEQIDHFELGEVVENKKNIIKDGINEIANNSFTKNDKRVTIIPKFLYNGSFMAYALGYDCYISISKYNKEDEKSTFAININPKSKDENGDMLKIPEEIIEKLKREIPVYKIDSETGREVAKEMFVKNGTQVIVGGPKNNELYVKYSVDDLCNKFTENELKKEQQDEALERIDGIIELNRLMRQSKENKTIIANSNRKLQEKQKFKKLENSKLK